MCTGQGPGFMQSASPGAGRGNAGFMQPQQHMANATPEHNAQYHGQPMPGVNVNATIQPATPTGAQAQGSPSGQAGTQGTGTTARRTTRTATTAGTGAARSQAAAQSRRTILTGTRGVADDATVKKPVLGG